MKKFLALVLALLMVMSMVACGTSDEGTSTAAPDTQADTQAATQATEPAETGKYDALDPVELVAADNCAPGAAGNLWFLAFAKQLEAITGGKMTVDYHGNSELGSDPDILRQTQSGDIQIQVSQTAPAASFVPELAVFDLPMVFASSSAEKIDSAINGDNPFTEGMRAAYEANGFVLLGYLQGATFRLTTSNKELRTLEDFASLKIRTMDNPNHLAFWKALGADPQPLAFAELYDALRLGTYDAEENAADTCLNSKFQEVQKYLALTNHILYCNQMTINKDFYDALDPAYQEAIQEAVKAATAEIAPNLVKIDADSKAGLVEGGIEIIEYNDDFYAGILENQGVKDLYAKIDADTNGLATKLQDALK